VRASNTQGQPGDNTAKPAYETAEQNLFTRFETNGGAIILPYAGLMFAQLSPSAGSALETLTLTYVTHTVTLEGTQLLPLLLIIQKGRAETIRIGGGPSNGTHTTPAVREITVAEGAQKSE
jgi:hypothetical protein